MNEILNFNTSVFDAVASDHLAMGISVKFNNNPDDTRAICIDCRPMTRKGINNMFLITEAADWSFLQSQLNANLKCNIFMDLLTNAFEISFPVKRKTVKGSKQIAWFDNGLEQMRETLHFLLSLRNHYGWP